MIVKISISSDEDLILMIYLEKNVLKLIRDVETQLKIMNKVQLHFKIE